jgi:hypothetical protein
MQSHFLQSRERSAESVFKLLQVRRRFGEAFGHLFLARSRWTRLKSISFSFGAVRRQALAATRKQSYPSLGPRLFVTIQVCLAVSASVVLCWYIYDADCTCSSCLRVSEDI